MFGWIFGVDEENKRAGDAATAQAKNVAFQKYNEGKYTLAQYNAIISRLDGNIADNAAADQQVQDAFVEGAKDGLNNAAGFIQDATSFSLGSTWKLIPWQVKIVGAIVIIIYTKPLWRNLIGGTK